MYLPRNGYAAAHAVCALWRLPLAAAIPLGLLYSGALLGVAAAQYSWERKQKR